MNKNVEKEFVGCFPKSNVEFGPWGVSVDGMKFVVRSMKKINQRDATPQNLLNIVEIKNHKGEDGWLYGEADAFAFETENKWILVMKADLQLLIKNKVKKGTPSAYRDSVYKFYQKQGRQDITTIVQNMDLVEIAFNIIRKP